jgi:hypothetical protein
VQPSAFAGTATRTSGRRGPGRRVCHSPIRVVAESRSSLAPRTVARLGARGRPRSTYPDVAGGKLALSAVPIGPSACGTAGVKRNWELSPSPPRFPTAASRPNPHRREPTPERHPSDVQLTRTKRLKSAAQDMSESNLSTVCSPATFRTRAALPQLSISEPVAVPPNRDTKEWSSVIPRSTRRWWLDALSC